jgi:rod shape-determining protein MreC
VKLERRSLSRLALPLKSLSDRFAFGLLIALSIGLLALGKGNIEALKAVETRIADGLAPILSLIAEPIAASRRLAGKAGELIALHQENARLREQNRRLLEWQTVARRLALENAGLRQVLHLEADPEPPTATAGRVVADTGGPFVHTVIVDAGAMRGVSKGMAAVNERGLVGRVTGVGARSARVLLLTDFNSRIPVMVEPSRDHAILAGDNTYEPGLIFLPLNPGLAVGDRVVTSGRGGVLPPGLPIGIVGAIDENKIAVTPFVDWDRLEYVRLLQYPAVTGPEAPAGPQNGAPAPTAPAGTPADEVAGSLVEPATPPEIPASPRASAGVPLP